MRKSQTGDTGASAELVAEYAAIAQSQLSIEERITLARKEGSSLQQNTAQADSLVLKRILEIIAMDAETRVRQALAQTLSENPDAPHDIVMQLASDEELVASPLLLLSEVLTSADLLLIIETQNSAAKMANIADRRIVPHDVSLALIEKGDDQVAGRLLRNAGAEISESGLLRVVDRFGKIEHIQLGLIDRTLLPATVMERVVSLVSGELLCRMVERHAVPVTLAAKIAVETREHATLGLTPGLSSDAMIALIAQIVDEGRFTESLLLRSLCLGNFEFIVHAIAFRMHHSVDYVRRRFAMADRAAVESLWIEAGFPTSLLQVLNTARTTLLETKRDSAKWSADYYQSRIVERMMTGSEDSDPDFTDLDIAFLIDFSKPSSSQRNDFVQDEPAIST